MSEQFCQLTLPLLRWDGFQGLPLWLLGIGQIRKPVRLSFGAADPAEKSALAENEGKGLWNRQDFRGYSDATQPNQSDIAGNWCSWVNDRANPGVDAIRSNEQIASGLRAIRKLRRSSIGSGPGIDQSLSGLQGNTAAHGFLTKGPGELMTWDGDPSAVVAHLAETLAGSTVELHARDPETSCHNGIECIKGT